MRACPACLSIYASEPEFCVFDGQRLQPDSVLAGRVLGEHRFDELIGIGGSGCVFRATHIPTGRPCALKLVYGEMATEQAVIERFRREAEAIQAIDHPNVVKILDVGWSPAGLIYLVMELVVGPTLKTIIDEQGPLHPRRAARLAEQLVDGLGQAHHRGFVHRDLKPGNIIISRDDHGAEFAKILDFGIVTRLQPPPKRRLTQTGFIVGTPTYMAPEQVDPKAVGPQADVYALGVILYEMLAGSPPFDGSLEQILVAKMTRRPAPLPDAGDFGDLVLQMLSPKPEDRPATALHVSAELCRLSLLSDDPKTVKADAFDDIDGAPFSALPVGDPPTQPTGVDEWRALTRRDDLSTGPVPSDAWTTDALPVVDVPCGSLPGVLETTADGWASTSRDLAVPRGASARAEPTLAEPVLDERDTALLTDLPGRWPVSDHPLLEPDEPASLSPPLVRPADRPTAMDPSDDDDRLDLADTPFNVNVEQMRARHSRSSAPFRTRPSWLAATAVAVMLTLSALVGFLLASHRENVLLDTNVPRSQQP